MADTDLLACPFCGWKTPSVHSTGQGTAWVACDRCLSQSGGFQDHDMPEHLLRDHAIQEWNRRVPASGAGWRGMGSAPHNRAVILGWHDWRDGQWCMEIGPASTGQRFDNGYSTVSRHGSAQYWLPLDHLPAAPDRRAG